MAGRNCYGCRDNNIVKGRVVTIKPILSRYKGFQRVNSLVSELNDRFTTWRYVYSSTKHEASKVNAVYIAKR
jgi:hypothetical protein